MKAETVLEIKNLGVEYTTLTDRIIAVKDINLKVNRQEALGIIGESGCGKSTLSYAIMDYLPSNGESSGEILFKGEDLLPLVAMLFTLLLYCTDSMSARAGLFTIF